MLLNNISRHKYLVGVFIFLFIGLPMLFFIQGPVSVADIFRGRIIDVTEKTYTIELTGDASKLDAFIEAVDRTAILETVRTGTSGIGRGERILRV